MQVLAACCLKRDGFTVYAQAIHCTPCGCPYASQRAKRMQATCVRQADHGPRCMYAECGSSEFPFCKNLENQWWADSLLAAKAAYASWGAAANDRVAAQLPLSDAGVARDRDRNRMPIQRSGRRIANGVRRICWL